MDRLDVWTGIKNPLKYVSALEYGNDTFIAMGYDGTAISNDGQTWTKKSWPGDDYVKASAFGNGVFVFGRTWVEYVDWLTDPYNLFYVTKDNGNSWYESRYEPYMDIYGLTYSNKMFIAVGREGDHSDGYKYDGKIGILASKDFGMNWEDIGSDSLYIKSKLMDVTFGKDSLGKNIIVAVGMAKINNSSDGFQYVAVSNDDGNSWTEKLFSEGIFYNVAYGNGYFIATDHKNIFRSKDGFSWSQINFQTTNIISKLIFAANLFVILTETGNICYSKYGDTWKSGLINSPDTAKFNTIGYGNSRFVVAGDNKVSSPTNDSGDETIYLSERFDQPFLSVSISPEGMGNVYSDPIGICCNGQDGATFPHNQLVTLYAALDDSNPPSKLLPTIFGGWDSSDSKPNKTANQWEKNSPKDVYTFNLVKDTHIIAHFKTLKLNGKIKDLSEKIGEQIQPKK